MEAHYQPAGWCRCGYRVDPGVCPECGRDNARPLKRDPRSRRQRWIKRGVRLLVVAAALGGIWLVKDELAIRFMPVGALDWIGKHTGAFTLGGGRRSWADDILWWRGRRLLNQMSPELRRRLLEPVTRFAGSELSGHFRRDQFTNRRELRIEGDGFVHHHEEQFEGGGIGIRWNHGSLVVDPDVLRLVPAVDRRLPYFDCPQRLIRVRWGGAEMLIETPRDLWEFCRSVNSGDVYEAVQHVYWTGADFDFLRLPVLPEPYRSWLMETPSRLRLVEVLEVRNETRGWMYEMNEVLYSVTARLELLDGEWIPPGSLLFPEPSDGPDGCERVIFEVAAIHDSVCLAVGKVKGTRLSGWPHVQVGDSDTFLEPLPGTIYTTRDPACTPEVIREKLAPFMRARPLSTTTE